ncbi:SpaH/EbpB family LPXTG-anchored major pilin [Microbacterium lacus]|uniref:SpaH/EbpB family LPXTG-anchored major pilin n=1 Tax=Microbacterium lacus TaxID=415217 RepID=UPI0038505982
MNASKKWRGTRAAAAVLAGALAALTLAMPASAATPNLIDPDTLGSITLHKYEAPDAATGLPNNGMPIDPANPILQDLVELNGVTFSYTQLDYDLTENSGWTALAAYTGDPAEAPELVDGASGSGVTGAAGIDGVVTFGNLPVGAYLIEETNYPIGVTPSAPFIITVPLTNPTNDNEWIYNVHAYPKNAITTAEKTVEDSEDVKIGDDIEFTITADIPNAEIIDAYQIVDVLDEKLDYLSTSVSLVDPDGVLADIVLVEGTHYTVVPAAATIDGPIVTIAFTPAGLDLLEANILFQVEAVITTEVNEVGEIVNEATVFPNQAAITNNTGTPTNEVITKWGGITLLKVSSEDAELLEGAKFQVWSSQTNDFTTATQVTGIGTDLPAPSDTWTTGTNGQVVIEGLRYSNWADGAAVAPGAAGYLYYWLVEIEAPEDHELLAAPVPFTVTTPAATTTVEVVNVPNNGGFVLPLTGGTGTTLFWAGGAMLLAGAVFLAIYSRRKSNASA